MAILIDIIEKLKKEERYLEQYKEKVEEKKRKIIEKTGILGKAGESSEEELKVLEK